MAARQTAAQKKAEAAAAKAPTPTLNELGLLGVAAGRKLTLAQSYLEDGCISTAAEVMREAADALELWSKARAAYLHAQPKDEAE